jgi:hypothetical protein
LELFVYAEKGETVEDIELKAAGDVDSVGYELKR